MRSNISGKVSHLETYVGYCVTNHFATHCVSVQPIIVRPIVTPCKDTKVMKDGA